MLKTTTGIANTALTKNRRRNSAAWLPWSSPWCSWPAAACVQVMGLGVSRHRCRCHDSSSNTLRGYLTLLSRELPSPLRYSHHHRDSIQSNARSTSD